MNKLKEIFNLHIGEDNKDKTLENVKNNISFSGANLWILACAIIVASVGLNVNSTAVIIGAMLISPLMGPIVSSGFALGMYDFELLKRSLNNLLIATAVGLIVSTFYFYLSPFKEAQSEILSRTTPNIYDILIAFFGGLAGVIAITRVEKGNPIPGVAIATALMPPLCTAGYGLAKGDIKYFLGALFLYSINCVFICISTFVIVKFLKYPAKEVEIKHQKQIKYGISILIMLMLFPSSYFAFTLYKEQKFKDSANKFINIEFNPNDNTLIYKRLRYDSHPKTIEIAFLLRKFTNEEIYQLNQKLEQYNLSNTKLIIKQDSLYNLKKLKGDDSNELTNTSRENSEKDLKILKLEDSLHHNTFDEKQLFSEIHPFYPNITSISISKNSFININDSVYNNNVLIYESKSELKISDKSKLKAWIDNRLNSNIIILRK